LDHFINRRVTKFFNVDITYRCPLECLRCARQLLRENNQKIPGRDLTLEEFDKITNFFTKVAFCGQYSDPIHHPKFIDFLRMCKEKNVRVEVHVASSFKSEEWFIEAFKIYPNAEWIFGIDGLPDQSHNYRINQDGNKLFNIMIKSKEHLITLPVWQYIIFKYNEHQLDAAKELAKNNNLGFIIINSARWHGEMDPLIPSIKV